jgi:hypothetical protein
MSALKTRASPTDAIKIGPIASSLRLKAHFTGPYGGNAVAQAPPRIFIESDDGLQRFRVRNDLLRSIRHCLA